MDTVTDIQLKFKFKHLKFHSSKMWLHGAQRRYRRVFYAPRITYMYFELALWNKMFDNENWSGTVTFKGYDFMNKELFTYPVTQTVNKTEDIAIFRSSWGVPTMGSYWTKGSYRIEAWINNFKICEDTFMVTDAEGELTPYTNPWFQLSSIKLYEGTGADVTYTERKYLNTFSSATTRYIYIEIEGKNIYTGKDSWPGEFIIRIKNELGELVAEISDYFSYTSEYKIIRFARGWGSDNAGTWFDGNYRIEVLFLEQMIGAVNFKIAQAEEADTQGGEFFVPDNINNIETTSQKPIKKPVTEAELMAEMNEMIGLDTIKKKIQELYEYIKFIQVRKDRGLEGGNTKVNIHSVFTGNPGTGKTKTAQLLGKVFFNLGILSKGHVYEVDRTVLVGQYIGHTAPKTKDAIKKAKGGILFIDEAYSLAREGDTDRDFGQEAIEILLKEMSDGDGDIVIICAGYPAEMKVFLDSNPGLKSRFNYHFQFPDYNPKELLEIGKLTAKNREVKLDEDAEEYLYKMLMTAYRDRDRTFGNARFVNSIIEEAKMNLGFRIIDDKINTEELDEDTLCTITSEDVKDVFLKQQGGAYDIPVDDELLHESLNELNSLIGIENIKQEISDIVKLVQYYKDSGKDVRKVFSLHSVFTGNPGTGKTTVARILARIYRALGILERGHLIEVDREGLVAGYVGQTAIKTAEKIEQAMGGVLFIDEAYSLSEGKGGTNDFGAEAIEVILKRMEDKRGEFIVICAGYTDNMEEFLKSNPGLKSRFDKKFHFNDYDENELFQIASKIFSENEVECDEKANEHVMNYIKGICSFRDKFFGNARDIRKAIDVVVKNQNLRLAGIDKSKRTKEMMKTILIDDVQELKVKMKEEKNFGFKT